MCVTRQIILRNRHPGLPEGWEKFLLDSAQMKKSCAYKSALAENALLMDARLWSWG